MVRTVSDVWRKRAILRYFVGVQLTTNYRTKSFGFLWALLDPLAFMGVYYVVFGMIIAHRTQDFMLHIYMGVMAFRFFSPSVASSAMILRGQAGMIREIAFPKALLPLSVVLARSYDYMGGWLAAVALAYIFHVHPTGWWLLIPLIMFIHVVFAVGFSLIMAYVGVFFADIQNILDVALRFWLYMSPVLYFLGDFRDKVALPDGSDSIWYHLYLLNPMTNILQCYNIIVYEARPPDLEFVVRAAVAAVITLIFGLWIFHRAEGQIGKYV